MANSAFTPSTSTVTNNVPVNVPVVTAPQSYTPTFSAGLGTVTNVSMSWSRRGTKMVITGTFKNGTTTASAAYFTLPNNLNINTNVHVSGKTTFGQISQTGSTASGTIISANVFATYISSNGTNAISISSSKQASSGNLTFISENGNTIFSGSETLSIQNLEIEIAEWSSGTTTLADRAVEEYASNISATDADDTGTTNFVYGIAGAAGILGATALSDIRKKRVRFTTPILATDKIEIEISPDGLNWYPIIGYRDPTYSIYPNVVLGIYNNTAGSSNSSGISYERVSGSTTDIYVVFGRYQTNMPSYTNNWSGMTGHKWRVRKVSSGAQVGYPVSARNIVGDTSGSAVPTGMIGERINGTIATGTNIKATIGNVSSVYLTPGTYMVYRKLTVGTSGQDTTTNMNINAEIVAGSSSTLPGGETYATFDYSNFSVGSQAPRWLMGGSYINVTSANTYYLNARVNYNGTLSTATVASESFFYAVRIA